MTISAAVFIGILAVAMVAPALLVVAGPSVFDRAIGAGVMGTTTLIILCLLGYSAGRLDMFVDIAMAYGMLNFVGALAVAKYLDASRTGARAGKAGS